MVGLEEGPDGHRLEGNGGHSQCCLGRVVLGLQLLAHLPASKLNMQLTPARIGDHCYKEDAEGQICSVVVLL